MSSSCFPGRRARLITALLFLGCGAPSVESAAPGSSTPTATAGDDGAPDATVVTPSVDPDDATGATLTTAEVRDVTFSTGALTVPYSEGSAELEASALLAGAPITITVTGTAGAYVRVNGTLVRTNQPLELTLPRLAADVVVHVEHLTLAGELVDQTVRTLPSDFPAYEVTADSPKPGRVFFTPHTWTTPPLTPYVVMTDELGAPLYYARTAGHALDFKWHELPGGRTRYTYVTGGDVVVLDEAFVPKTKLRLLATASHGEYLADPHDVLVLDDDHYVVASYVTKTVGDVPEALAGDNLSPHVVAAVLQEVKAGAVVFEWDSSAVPELYASATDGNDFAHAVTDATAADYVHWNAVQIDPKDGNFVLSFRHQDAILKLDRSSGEILWTLGGERDEFGLSDAQRFSHQHFARFQPDGTLLFYDNGNASGRTRVVRMGLDEAAHTVTSFSAWSSGRYALAMGSVQALDDATWFLGWGAKTDTGDDVTEIDHTSGTTHFALRLPASYYSYRAVKRLAL